jgi:predicted GNAT family acetyltransferase
MAAPQNVIDNTEAHRFELTVDGHLAELVYRLDGDRLVLVHTGVPEELGGQGIGGVLVEAALDRARTERLTVVAQCAFAKAWIEKHPDAATGVSVAAS